MHLDNVKNCIYRLTTIYLFMKLRAVSVLVTQLSYATWYHFISFSLLFPPQISRFYNISWAFRFVSLSLAVSMFLQLFFDFSSFLDWFNIEKLQSMCNIKITHPPEVRVYLHCYSCKCLVLNVAAKNKFDELEEKKKH